MSDSTFEDLTPSEREAYRSGLWIVEDDDGVLDMVFERTAEGGDAEDISPG